MRCASPHHDMLLQKTTVTVRRMKVVLLDAAPHIRQPCRTSGRRKRRANFHIALLEFLCSCIGLVHSVCRRVRVRCDAFAEMFYSDLAAECQSVCKSECGVGIGGDRAANRVGKQKGYALVSGLHCSHPLIANSTRPAPTACTNSSLSPISQQTSGST